MSRLVRIAVCGCVGLLSGVGGALAQGAAKDQAWREIWGGAEAGPHAWSAYAGQTYALFGVLAEDGWRLRALSGYGRYRYETTRWNGVENAAQLHHGTVAFADVLLGYHKQSGPLTIKIFAGLSGDAHTVTPFDQQNGTQGFAYGAKAVLESWLNIGDSAWTSLDLSWSSAHEMSTSRARVGYRVLPAWSVGVEGGHVDTSTLLTLRGGVFLRGEWASGEASISGGVSDDDRAARPAAYGTINVLWRF